MAVLGLHCCMDFSLVAAHGFLIVVASLGSVVCFMDSRALAHELWFVGSRVLAQELWHMGLVALPRVRSSWIRDWIHVSCIGRWILYHEL